MTLLLAFAFLSGLATIVSPCVLPVLPLILSTSAAGGRARPFGIILGFAASFTAAALLLGAAVQALGLPQDWLRTAAVVALGVFGLLMLVPAWGRGFERAAGSLARNHTAQPKSGFFGGVLLGAGLGIVWSPCVGPIMASVIALAVTSGVSVSGAGIALAYAVGAGLPMLALSYGARSLATRFKGLGPHSGAIRQGFGAITVLTCLLLLFGLQSNVQTLLPTAWSNNLTAFESSAPVQKEIDNLQPEKPALPPVAAALEPTSTAVATAVTSTPPAAIKTPTVAPDPANPGLALKDLGEAPDFTGIEGWINSGPLTMSSLKGKVVLVDFWTFECYNCRNTLPYVIDLYNKYHSQGLEIVGVHTPEFAYERVPENVANATKEQKISWPVALDPNYKTWSAYNNRYWPAFYFIDAQGHIRYTHFGEGNYSYNEKVVQQLLYEAAHNTADNRSSSADTK